MLMPSSMKNWLRLPSRVALLMGLGALSAAGAKADATAHPDGDAAWVPQQSAKAFGDLLIWSDAGRIYVSEAGKPAEELHLGKTAEAEALRQLLGRDGATAATPQELRDRIILVGSGGGGLHWKPPGASDAAKQAPAPATSGSAGADPNKPTAGAGDGASNKTPTAAASGSVSVEPKK
jgi:hypothetical protein